MTGKYDPFSVGESLSDIAAVDCLIDRLAQDHPYQEQDADEEILHSPLFSLLSRAREESLRDIPQAPDVHALLGYSAQEHNNMDEEEYTTHDSPRGRFLRRSIVIGGTSISGMFLAGGLAAALAVGGGMIATHQIIQKQQHILPPVPPAVSSVLTPTSANEAPLTDTTGTSQGTSPAETTNYTTVPSSEYATEVEPATNIDTAAVEPPVGASIPAADPQGSVASESATESAEPATAELAPEGETTSKTAQENVERIDEANSTSLVTPTTPAGNDTQNDLSGADPAQGKETSTVEPTATTYVVNN